MEGECFMNLILILAAVIPALFLLLQVYRADRLEKEPFSLLLSLLFWGIIATELASLSEQIGILLLQRLFRPNQSLTWNITWAGQTQAVAAKNSAAYDVLLYFGVVAVSEEGFKFLLLHRRTWSEPEFNCCFDGVVYAVFLSLGFALWENIRYVLAYGFATAVARALTAVPGHACFGVFMGAWYGAARRAALVGRREKSLWLRFLAFLIPCLLHGAYDFIAVTRMLEYGWLFLPFVAAMFLGSAFLVRRLSRGDSYL